MKIILEYSFLDHLGPEPCEILSSLCIWAGCHHYIFERKKYSYSRFTWM